MHEKAFDARPELKNLLVDEGKRRAEPSAGLICTRANRWPLLAHPALTCYHPTVTSIQATAQRDRRLASGCPCKCHHAGR
jgi:hypothetical protein